jgi:DNA-binding NarL/FixJ family response regulator
MREGLAVLRLPAATEPQRLSRWAWAADVILAVFLAAASVNAATKSAGVLVFGISPDDQALVRTGFRMILGAAGIEVVAEAADGAEAVETVRRTRPDLVLMDIGMPVLDGLEATRRILSGASAGEPRVLILTTFDLDQYVYAALAAGASGFLLKDTTPEYLVAAVRLVREGDALLAPAITRRLVARFANGTPRTTALHRDLATLTHARWKSCDSSPRA